MRFTDSAAWPTLSPDDRMLAFYGSNRPFLTPDDIWVKLLPNGEPIQVTHDPRPKYNVAFSPDGSGMMLIRELHAGDIVLVPSFPSEAMVEASMAAA